jgi:hypothetical protein
MQLFVYDFHCLFVLGIIIGVYYSFTTLLNPVILHYFPVSMLIQLQLDCGVCYLGTTITRLP